MVVRKNTKPEWESRFLTADEFDPGIPADLIPQSYIEQAMIDAAQLLVTLGRRKESEFIKRLIGFRSENTGPVVRWAIRRHLDEKHIQIEVFSRVERRRHNSFDDNGEVIDWTDWAQIIEKRWVQATEQLPGWWKDSSKGSVVALPCHLGLVAIPAELKVRRGGEMAEFGDKVRAWNLFCQLLVAGDDGCKRQTLFDAIWGSNSECNPNNLDQQKSTLEGILGSLSITIRTDQKGLWKLANSEP